MQNYNEQTENTVIRATVDLPLSADPVRILGVADENLRSLEEYFPQVSFWVHGLQIHLQGPPEQVEQAHSACEELITQSRLAKHVSTSAKPVAQNGVFRSAHTTHSSVLPGMQNGQSGQPGGQPAQPSASGAPRAGQDAVLVTPRGKNIGPLTPGQDHYVQTIAQNTVTFGIGPAGTGKTYLAMAMAVSALLNGEVERLILTRPAVEAGESLGFLPGTLYDKIDPYLRPLYDALREMVDESLLPKLLDSGTIEVAPLAYMRGRTLNDAFIILDEAQNTTSEQMKMFLTRLGMGSKVVVTGDVTQIDLPRGKASGLAKVREILAHVPDIAFCTLSAADVVRHELVGRIIQAWAEYDERSAQQAITKGGTPSQSPNHGRYVPENREKTTEKS